ncbi:MAG: MraY family glycosyltransferase [Planctomycetota bacterium]|nr:MraY family glycosyltransferase [Planctomycetota bacterium]
MTPPPAHRDLELFPDQITPPAPHELDLADAGEPVVVGAMNLLNSYAHVLVVAFVVTLLFTPLVRRLALAGGVVDRPDARRKMHDYPVPYLGGLAVFIGLIVAIAVSYFSGDDYTTEYAGVPLAVVVGMVAITFTGLADDVWGWDPRLKIAGQLVAAAALAIEDVGVRVAEGLLNPVVLQVMGESGPGVVLLSIGGFDLLSGHVFYWTGTALIAVFVLGGCNAANLLDGLDGLLSGVVGVVAIGLLAICLLMIPSDSAGMNQARDVADLVQQHVVQYHEETGTYPKTVTELVDAGTLQREETAMPQGWTLLYGPRYGRVAVDGRLLGGARIVLCMALLGAVLGFLPHNFNPASIFLGDCGSLLLGYMCAVIILMLGDRGETHLVFAGLIVFSLPIMDTTLAIIRRWLAGTPLSVPDRHHIHHQLLHALGGVKRAVLSLYGISFLFAALGVTLAGLVMQTGLRVRVIYTIALVLFSFIGVVAVKAARTQQREAAKSPARRGGGPARP